MMSGLSENNSLGKWKVDILTWCSKAWSCTILNEWVIEVIDLYHFDETRCHRHGAKGHICGKSVNETQAQQILAWRGETTLLKKSGHKTVAPPFNDQSLRKLQLSISSLTNNKQTSVNHILNIYLMRES